MIHSHNLLLYCNITQLCKRQFTLLKHFCNGGLNFGLVS